MTNAHIKERPVCAAAAAFAAAVLQMTRQSIFIQVAILLKDHVGLLEWLELKA